MDAVRRNLLKAAAILIVDQWAGLHRTALASAPKENAGRKVIVVACGGIRREDSFSESGFDLRVARSMNTSTTSSMQRHFSPWNTA